MNFRSKLQLEASPRPSNHADHFLALGSCFAETIGTRLQRGLFHTCINPLGTLYSPIALAAILERAVNRDGFHAQDFFLHHELWRHFDVHSSLASTDREKSLATANEQLRELSAKLLQADRLIITLGSAWVYRDIESGVDVAHNHKLPLARFEKRLIPVEEIASRLESALRSVRHANPKVRVLLTVSPVRHLRDGLHQNNLSKSTLLLATAELEKRLDFVDYFPAYELVIDDLRDYRFFESDLAHPTELAIEYVWEAFIGSQLTVEAADIIARVKSLRNSLEHHPTHPRTQAYRDLIDRAEREILQLSQLQLDVSSLQDALQRRHDFL